MNYLLTFVLLLSLTSCQAQPVESEEKLISISNEILQNLVQEKFEAVRQDFNSQMKDALGKEQLSQVWSGLAPQVGAYVKAGKTTSGMLNEHRVIYTILKFENAPLKLKTVFDQEDKVAGLFIVPVNAP